MAGNDKFFEMLDELFEIAELIGDEGIREDITNKLEDLHLMLSCREIA